MKRILLLLSIGICLQGCQADDPVVLNEPADEPVAVAFENIFKFEYAYNDSATGYHVFNDEVAWLNFAQGINSPFDIDPETGESISQLLAVDVDFTSHTVIAVVDEPRNNGGYDISVQSVVQDNEEVIVAVQTVYPGPGAVTAVLTQPIHIVKIPKTTLPVIFDVN